MARLVCDLPKLEANARVLVRAAGERGIEVFGVTKAVHGEPRAAAAMVKGGVAGLADSRLLNLERLRRAGYGSDQGKGQGRGEGESRAAGVPLMLLRLPDPREAEDVVRFADVSLNSEIETVRALGKAAEAAGGGLIHSIILMIDLGDLREGVWPEKAVEVAAAMDDIPGVRLQGIGTNLTCYGGVVPTSENLGLLARLRRQIEERLGYPLAVVSGGNSSTINLLLTGGVPAGVNQLRLGESILLGRETVAREPMSGTYQDVFTLYAPIIEMSEKPSAPIGITAQDAFGHTRTFVDRGWRRRVLVAVGRQDTGDGAITPVLPGAMVLGASSDHTIVDLTGSARPAHGLAVGDELAFHVNYGALLALITSPFVEKVWLDEAPADTSGLGGLVLAGIHSGRTDQQR